MVNITLTLNGLVGGTDKTVIPNTIFSIVNLTSMHFLKDNQANHILSRSNFLMLAKNHILSRSNFSMLAKKCKKRQEKWLQGMQLHQGRSGQWPHSCINSMSLNLAYKMSRMSPSKDVAVVAAMSQKVGRELTLLSFGRFWLVIQLFMQMSLVSYSRFELCVIELTINGLLNSTETKTWHNTKL